MIDGRRVIAWTPYGRRETVSVLIRYMAREHAAGRIDGYWLYMNTDPTQEQDVAYAHELADTYPWVSLIRRPVDVPVLSPKQRMTGFAYRYFTDPGAIYLRLDDDIVYVHEDAVSNLVRAKAAMSGCLAAFPLIVNNAVCSHWMQQHGVIGREYGDVGLHCMDQVGWANPDMGLHLHRTLLDRIRAGTVSGLYLYQDIPLPERLQFSVSCFAVDGRDYATLDPPGWLGYSEEESFHTVEWPARAGKINMIIGNALVAHYTFGPQRALPANATRYADVLAEYRALAEQL